MLKESLLPLLYKAIDYLKDCFALIKGIQNKSYKIYFRRNVIFWVKYLNWKSINWFSGSLFVVKGVSYTYFLFIYLQDIVHELNINM